MEKNKKEENPFVENPPTKKVQKVQIVKPGEINKGEKKPISVRTERFFDRHNHKMEFLRTLFSLSAIPSLTSSISLRMLIIASMNLFNSSKLSNL